MSLPISFNRIVEVTDSHTISKVAYDIEGKVLRVWFLSTGSVWDYYNVYPTDFAKLVAGYSVGEVFNQRIRTRFECARVEGSDQHMKDESIDGDTTTGRVKSSLQKKSSVKKTSLRSTTTKVNDSKRV